MEENQSGAQHLAKLDLDISGIYTSLQNAQAEIERMSIEVGKTLNTNMQKAVNDAVKVKLEKTPTVLNEQELKKTEQAVDKITKSYERLAEEVFKQDANGKPISLTKTYDDEYGNKRIEKKIWDEEISEYELLNETIINGIQKREKIDIKAAKEAAAQRKKEEEDAWAFYEQQEKKRLNKIDEERKAWEELNKQKNREDESVRSSTDKEVSNYNKQLEKEQKLLDSQQEKSYKKYEQMQDAKLKKIEEERLAWERYYKDKETEERKIAELTTKESKDYFALEEKKQKEVKETVANLQTMIEKQTKFNSLVNRQKPSRRNRAIISESKTYINQIELLIDRIKKSGKVSDDARNSIEKLQSSVKNLGVKYEETGSKGYSVFRRIGDKAKWLGAFYIVNELKEGLQESIRTIKETEDAVVDLQRVLNDKGLENSVMSEELYKIGTDYGRTFQEVSEVATAFAQAGNDWNDTMKLTQGTMLALNTAELDVTQSTQGLIAIMSQWNYTADDYVKIIDKINYTADNYAVTSEKIVSALQRSSSTARIAGLSFEETIGSITALAEATGRSGENIGTALNSLLLFTSNDKSLQIFADNGSQAMKDLVSEYRKGTKSIFDIWRQLSVEVKNLSAEQQKALFDTQGYSEFASTLESQATEYADQVREIYGVAGKYRQNYFTALLDDMTTAQGVVDQMSDAEGHSARENEKYMETLTAQWNQMKNALAELAVQLGDLGLTDILKFTVKLGTGLAKLTKDLGGVFKVTGAILGLMVAFRAQKIASNVLLPIGRSFTKLRANVELLKIAMASADSNATRLKIALGGLGSGATLAARSMGLLTTAISVFLMISYNLKQREEERNRQQIENNKETIKQVNELAKLTSSYNTLVETTSRTALKESQLKEINEKITKSLGDRAVALNGLKVGTEEYTKALNEQTRAELEGQRTLLQSNLTLAKEGLKTPEIFTEAGGATLKGDIKEIQDIFEKYMDTFKKVDSTSSIGMSKVFYVPKSKDSEDILDYISALQSAKDEMDKLGSTSELMSEKVANSEAYKKITNALNEAQASFTAYLDAQTQLQINEIVLRDGFPKTKKELELLKEEVFKATGANDVFKDSIFKIVDSAFPALSGAFSDSATEISNALGIPIESIKALEEEIKSLNSTIDGFQSGIDTVNNAINEYNQNGFLSVDTVQAMVSAGSEYISLLDFTADGVKINTDKARELLDAQKNNVKALIEQTTYSGLLEIAQRYLGDSIELTSEKTENSEIPIDNLAIALRGLSGEATNAAFSVSMTGDAIEKAFSGKVSGNKMVEMKKEMTDYLSSMNDVYHAIGDITKGEDAWGKAVGGAAKSVSDTQKKALEEQKKAIKERYDAEIDALKKVKSERDRERKEEEYYRKRQDALRDISKAETRSGVEFREKEEDARKKLEELDRSWYETLEDWSIEDKIKELERLRDSEIAALDAQIKRIQQTVSSTATTAVSTFGEANEQISKDYEKDVLEWTVEKSKEYTEKQGKDTIDIFGAVFGAVERKAENMAKSMYKAYDKEFIKPVRDALGTVNFFPNSVPQKYKLPPIPSTPQPPYASNYGYGAFANQTNTYSTSNNANIFANVYGENTANAMFGNFPFKP